MKRILLPMAFLLPFLFLLSNMGGKILTNDPNYSLKSMPPDGRFGIAIPSRSKKALSGSEFIKKISGLDSKTRENLILKEIEKGNIPDFLRILVPVELKRNDSSKRAEPKKATIWVMPDYLAIGSNSDFVRIPMTVRTAKAIAAKFGFVLPTTKMVDAIYEQAKVRLKPKPLPISSKMVLSDYYYRHHKLLTKQLPSPPYGALVSGHKKDVVMCERKKAKKRVAIYGWHTSINRPIQPLSTIHHIDYVDYSHGIRLIKDIVLVEDRIQSFYAAYKNSNLKPFFTNDHS